ncbi:hypothetical protein Vretimale_3213 [Volvox reticuliferus]|uniref:Uncharacterized protein n=2 Tax=Volvox reticuliferus TaxID=1737510 RepID=A0A8J4D8C2_9CHLO|nr:hypothetical protein Vretimale_3213 [Volvox reticuliferus]
MDGEAWTYELDDGAPVNPTLHGTGNVTVIPSTTSSRVPFGDVTSNFAEYYAPFLDNGDLKSPDRYRRSRFSPNRPPCNGAVKRSLWNKDLPPMAPIMQTAPSSLDERLQPSERDVSPTRHALRTLSVVGIPDACPAKGNPSDGIDGASGLACRLSVSNCHIAINREAPVHNGTFAVDLGSNHESVDESLPPRPSEEVASNEEADENAFATLRNPDALTLGAVVRVA